MSDSSNSQSNRCDKKPFCHMIFYRQVLKFVKLNELSDTYKPPVLSNSFNNGKMGCYDTCYLPTRHPKWLFFNEVSFVPLQKSARNLKKCKHRIRLAIQI